ncbi:MAG: hypothetical protein L6R38_009462 [Xanthoria sp. 2 TBL-2021]|nr:MAG: hypothetical protein L6R38_009462 [Xanthoria sp. 2 TBL-2021]
MADDGSRIIRRPAESPGVGAGPRRQVLPDLIISPGVMVISTESGTKAIFTAAPTHFTGVHSVLSTDPQTFTNPLPSPTPPSTTPAPTQGQPASSTPSVQAAPSHQLSHAKLAAVIVVPLVLLVILTPIIIIYYINWRRKRRLAKRRSDRSTKSLIEHYHGAPGASRHHNKRATSNPPPRKSRKPHRIVSVPTPTFSSFNFELSRPASAMPLRSSNEQTANGVTPRGRRSATFSWGAPPPYTSPTRDTHSSTPIPRLDTPSFTGSPFLETAQMVHLRPVSGQQPRLHRSTSRRSAAAQSSTRLTQSYYPPQQARDTMLQPPDFAWTRHESTDSTAESLHHRSTLQRPFSFHGLPSPTFSDVSGLSFDPYLMYPEGSDSAVSPIDDEDETERTRPHQVV